MKELYKDIFSPLHPSHNVSLPFGLCNYVKYETKLNSNESNESFNPDSDSTHRIRDVKVA